MLKAVIFDMDGVIIDSEPLHAKAAILALSHYGVTLTTEYCYSFIGSTAKHMLEVVKETYHLTASIEELMEANRQAKIQLLQQEGYPAIPYVRELMQNLAEHNLLLAIASSSPLEDIQSTVHNLDLTPFLTTIVSGMQVAHPKPAPDIFLKAASALGVEPFECIVIEDSYNGVTAACAAGMPVLGFANPHSGNQNLWQANCICESFESVDTAFLQRISQKANGEPLTIGETNRLYLKELTQDNIPELYRIYQAPQVTEFIPALDTDPALEAQKQLAYQKYAYDFYGYGFWGVFRKSDHHMLGCCGIQNATIDHTEEIELGYVFDSAEWGNGYALECARFVLEYALTELDISRIVAVMDTRNLRSIHLAEQLGMKKEKNCMHQNRTCVLYVYDKAEI